MDKIYIQSHGCSTNISEAEAMKGLLAKAGFKVTEDIAKADMIILNTCTVKGEFGSLRQVRKFREQYPKKKLIVAGCITKELIKDIRKITESASLINTHNITKIVEVVEETINGNIIEAISYQSEKKIRLPKVRKNPVVGVVPISSGCNNQCAYCSVRLVKGKLESYSREEIVEEINEALKDGCKEIWITSQDNAAYATENIWRSSLPELLKEILAIEKDFKIRIGMMNPFNIKPITEELIEIFKNDKVFKFLHVPLQSGNDEVLKKMKRRYSVEEFKTLVNTFRREIPQLTFATDVIIGFPGETIDQFNDSLDVIKELRPDVLNISKYIPRPRTEAAMMDDKILERDIKHRSRIMTEIFGNISRMNNEKWLNWQGEIIIDEKGKHDSWVGRNFAYKQVIVNGNYKIGDIVNVKVTDTTTFDLRAERVD